MFDKLKLVLIGAIIGASTINTPASSVSSSKTIPMTQVADISENNSQQTYCLGHFLIDVPLGSQMTGGNYKYNGARLEGPLATSHEAFLKELSELEDHLRATKHNTDPSLLREIKKVDADNVIMAYWDDPYSGGVMNVVGYKFIDSHKFYIRDGAGIGLTRDKSKTRQQLVIDSTQKTLSYLRTRNDSEIPQDPGYCFAGGFIANPDWEAEEAAMDFRVAHHPDVIVSITIYPLESRKHDAPLLERMGGVMQSIGGLATGVHVLRKGARNIGDIDGQEYLSAAPNSGGARAHMFMWETQGHGTLEDPFISIEMTSGNADSKGNAQKTSLTDDSAEKLWDGIVGSFRLRPTVAGSKVGEIAPIKLPIGSVAVTGRKCGQTGVWECDERNAVDNEKRRVFNEGDTMPRVLANVELGLWQKVRGERPRQTLATSWTLVSYDSPVSTGRNHEDQSDKEE